MNVATAQTTEVARPLRVLVPLIKNELEAADEAGLDHYKRAGEMLIEAKDQFSDSELSRGEWGKWLARNFHLSMDTAQRYMRLIKVLEAPRARSTPYNTLSSAVEPHRKPGHRPSWHEPVQQSMAALRAHAFTQEIQSVRRENELLRELSHRLIDIGYKVLASKLHPDKGGSAEAMARLNKVRKTLKGAI